MRFPFYKKRPRNSHGALGIMLLLLLTPRGAGAQGRENTSYDPRALKLLQQMVETYASLSSLQQKTEYYAALTPLNPPPQDPQKSPSNTTSAAPGSTTSQPAAQEQKLTTTLRLVYAAPNRLLMERTEESPLTGKPVVSRWISDGKTFWSYSEEKNWYTKEPTPGRLRDFSKLTTLNTGCMELMMLMGVNPFANVKNLADSIFCDSPTTLHDVPTEVVVLRSETEAFVTEARFYIGKADSLLRRLAIETKPVTAQAARPGVVGDALDELAELAPSTSPPPDPNDPNASTVVPQKSRYVCDNILTAPSFDAQTFAFKIPPGALLHEPFDPTGKRNAKKIEDQITEYLKQFQKKKGKAAKLKVLKF